MVDTEDFSLGNSTKSPFLINLKFKGALSVKVIQSLSIPGTNPLAKKYCLADTGSSTSRSTEDITVPLLKKDLIVLAAKVNSSLVAFLASLNFNWSKFTFYPSSFL